MLNLGCGRFGNCLQAYTLFLALAGEDYTSVGHDITTCYDVLFVAFCMYIALILVMARVYFINRLLMTTCSNAFPPHPPGSSLALRIRLLPHSSTHSLSTSCDVGSYAPFSADNVMADPHTTNTRTSQSIAWSTKRVKEWPVRLSHQCATTSKSGNDEHELKIIAQSNYCHLDRYLAASHGRSSSVCPSLARKESTSCSCTLSLCMESVMRCQGNMHAVLSTTRRIRRVICKFHAGMSSANTYSLTGSTSLGFRFHCAGLCTMLYQRVQNHCYRNVQI